MNLALLFVFVALITVSTSALEGSGDASASTSVEEAAKEEEEAKNFQSLVRDVVRVVRNDVHFPGSTSLLLHEAVEDFLVGLLEEENRDYGEEGDGGGESAKGGEEERSHETVWAKGIEHALHLREDRQLEEQEKDSSGNDLQEEEAKRHRMLIDPLQKIRNLDIRRLARRGGVKRISGLIYEETRGVLKVFLENVIRDSAATAEKAGRKTITASDVDIALKWGKCQFGKDK